jgi:hypothetical protein
LEKKDRSHVLEIYTRRQSYRMMGVRKKEGQSVNVQKRDMRTDPSGISLFMRQETKEELEEYLEK